MATELALFQTVQALSSKVFAYESPLSAVAEESLPEQFVRVQTRAGALAIALGYIFSTDLDRNPHVPRSIIAPSAAIPLMRRALGELVSAGPALSGPVVFHVNTTDYSARSDSFLSDAAVFSSYAAVLETAADAGLAVVTSSAEAETQHIAVLATAISQLTPTAHLYDGVWAARSAAGSIDSADALELYRSLVAEGSSQDLSEYVLSLFSKLNSASGTSYAPFEYRGHPEATTILVVLGGTEWWIASRVADDLSQRGSKVGVINVRLYRPFLEQAFLELLPASVQKVSVLGQVRRRADVSDGAAHSALFSDVFATTVFAGRDVAVSEIKYFVPPLWTPDQIYALFSHASEANGSTDLDSALGSVPPERRELVKQADLQQISVWETDTSPMELPEDFSKTLAAVGKVPNTAILHDNLVLGGVTRTDIRVSKAEFYAPYPVQNVDIAVVGDGSILANFDVVGSIVQGGALAIREPKPDASDEDVEKIIPEPARVDIAKRALEVLVFASKNVTEVLFEKKGRKFNVPADWANIADVTQSLPYAFSLNSFSRVNHDKEEEAAQPGRLQLVQSIVFPEALEASSRLRPDVPVATNTVMVQQVKRLTPESYDRNVFHIEFDLGTTGITYAIGEALGVHPTNDPALISSFLEEYGLDPDELISLPLAGQDGLVGSNTVYQSLTQHVDLFGQPPKRFYEDLAAYATDEAEKKALEKLSAPEGVPEFKRRAEVDFVTFADILLEFRSAKLSAAEVVKLVPAIKRREYSIASSQRVTPNSVSLLVVTVEWADSRGRSRAGLATRFLNSLRVGDSVTVSVKPSVMKLPADPSRPIIMAGLGTGLAPFRAFVQERALQKSEGVEVGPMLLFLGSRHQREEYLFGEEWEAYRDAGVITLLGCAFSRDQAEKIYIQDRMREALVDLKDAYISERGSFYLCGPTWPVPDVTAVLQEAVELAAAAGKTKSARADSRRVIEEFKEEGRYVLEVY